MNIYLFIIGVLIILLSIKMDCKSNFTPLMMPSTDNPVNPQPSNLFETTIDENNFKQPYLLDSRYRYPNNPPVSPNVFHSEIVSGIPGSQELYGEPVSNLLDDNELIKIPLQYNTPNQEALRSQDILITPYNRIKYSTRSPSSYAN